MIGDDLRGVQHRQTAADILPILEQGFNGGRIACQDDFQARKAPQRLQRPGYRRLGGIVAAHGVQENTHVGEPPLKYRMIANITDEQLILPRAMQECKLRGG